jgi:hypothetical protein
MRNSAWTGSSSVLIPSLFPVLFSLPHYKSLLSFCSPPLPLTLDLVVLHLSALTVDVVFLWTYPR